MINRYIMVWPEFYIYLTTSVLMVLIGAYWEALQRPILLQLTGGGLLFLVQGKCINTTIIHIRHCRESIHPWNFHFLCPTIRIFHQTMNNFAQIVTLRIFPPIFGLFNKVLIFHVCLCKCSTKNKTQLPYVTIPCKKYSLKDIWSYLLWSSRSKRKKTMPCTGGGGGFLCPRRKFLQNITILCHTI